jgi:hypothetical protein
MCIRKVFIPLDFFHNLLPYSLILKWIIIKLEALGLNPALCNWVLDFLTGCPQVVKVGNSISTSLILNTGAPQWCVLSPLLYSLFTHDSVAMPPPIHMDWTVVEKVESFKFLSIHITDKLKWSSHTDSVVKKA